MIRLRNLACAYLKYKDEILMMKRAPTMKLYPGAWSPIGGHMEGFELNDPMSACIREINEETGLKEQDLLDMQLKYITYRRINNELRIQHIYFGTALRKDVTSCSEGELFWINQDDLLNLKMSFVNTNILQHYFKIGRTSRNIFIAAASGENDNPKINISAISNLDRLF